MRATRMNLKQKSNFVKKLFSLIMKFGIKMTWWQNINFFSQRKLSICNIDLIFGSWSNNLQNRYVKKLQTSKEIIIIITLLAAFYVLTNNYVYKKKINGFLF